MTIDRVILIVLDSLGIEASLLATGDDTPKIGAGRHAKRHSNGLRLPNLERLGLGNILPLEGVARVPLPLGACGQLTRSSASRGSTAGHWELAGLELDQPFGTFPDGFPRQIIETFSRQTGRGVLGNRQAPGQAMLDELATEHLHSGDWIVFTSADSVLQLAAHEDVVSIDELNEACRVAQRLLAPLRLCRVVARPFKGPKNEQYAFTSRRREYSLPPPRLTTLDALTAHGISTVGIGRISDFFAGQGLVEKINSQGNSDGMIKTVEAMARHDRGLFMLHLPNLETLDEQPQSPESHARCLGEFDIQLAMLLSRAGDNDLLLLTADHGPVQAHSTTANPQELVPILAAGPAKAAGVDLGIRQSFADVGATIAEIFGIEAPEAGESFLEDIS